MSAKEKKSAASEQNVIATNRKARFEYEILEKFEAGISLVGSEVKSLRNRDVSIAEAFARPKDDEVLAARHEHQAVRAGEHPQP